MMYSITRSALKKNDPLEVNALLRGFYRTFSNAPNLEKVITYTTFKGLWEDMFMCFSMNSDETVIQDKCLMCIETLSRNETYLNTIITQKYINILLQSANLVEETCISTKIEDTDLIVSGLKVLCNIIQNSKTGQDICCNNKTVDCIILRLKTYLEHNTPNDILYLDLKLLFIFTTVNKDMRIKIIELHGHMYLAEVLDKTLRDAIDSENSESFLEKENVLVSCEAIKTLFNLTLIPINDSSKDGDDSIWIKLIPILNDLLVTSIFFPSFQETIIRNVANLLTNVPTNWFDQLLIDHHLYGLNALKAIIDFLDNQLSSAKKSTFEEISPILLFLLKGSRSIVKFHHQVRYQILPPLKNVVNQIGKRNNTLRDKLCRLLTVSDEKLRALVAEFLFVLCNESAKRMIKYTGFDITSDLFINRGLFRKTSNPNYSLIRGDSDTEKYQINPVHDSFESLDPIAMKNMFDEQHEDEVIELVSKMDKLKSGVVPPCENNDDGHLKSIEHVHQLQEEIISDFNNVTNKDDSDDLSYPTD